MARAEPEPAEWAEERQVVAGEADLGGGASGWGGSRREGAAPCPRCLDLGWRALPGASDHLNPPAGLPQLSAAK